MTYRAVGAVALLTSLAVLMLGLGVAFAALFMKFAAELPPSGAAMISAFSLMAVGAGLALLARVFKPRAHAPAKPNAAPKSKPTRKSPRRRSKEATIRMLRDGFGPTKSAPAVPPATVVPFGAGVMGELTGDHRPPRSRRRARQPA